LFGDLRQRVLLHLPGEFGQLLVGGPLAATGGFVQDFEFRGGRQSPLPWF
jgi:hypothetical protein